MATKVFHPVIKVVKGGSAASPKVDLGACLDLARRRSRVTDIMILWFGIGVGVLLYAFVHDLLLRYRRRSPEDVAGDDCDSRCGGEHARTCAALRVRRPGPGPSPLGLALAHSHHLSSSPPPAPSARAGPRAGRFLLVPSPPERELLADEKV